MNLIQSLVKELLGDAVVVAGTVVDNILSTTNHLLEVEKAIEVVGRSGQD